MADYRIESIRMHKTTKASAAVLELLLNEGIRFEANADYTAGVFDGDILIATGSLFKNILKCIAVRSAYQGENVLGQIISHLQTEIWERGYHSCYVYTSIKSSPSFMYLGFNELARLDSELVFLEKAVYGIQDYLNALKREAFDGSCSAIVMNANPFTKGHQYLVEQAHAYGQPVYVFVLSEDLSVFPFEIRKQLVEAGVSHLENVKVLETNHYMVSAQTFPSYFLKETSDITRTHAKLDATLFKEKIAKALNITVRFVGEEPFSEATAIYNSAMQEVFGSDLELKIIPRRQAEKQAISATRVRKELKNRNFEALAELVPETTLAFLKSEAAEAIIEKLEKEA